MDQYYSLMSDLEFITGCSVKNGDDIENCISVVMRERKLYLVKNSIRSIIYDTIECFRGNVFPRFTSVFVASVFCFENFEEKIIVTVHSADL